MGWKWSESSAICLFVSRRLVVIDQSVGICDQGDKPKRVICQISINQENLFFWEGQRKEEAHYCKYALCKYAKQANKQNCKENSLQCDIRLTQHYWTFWSDMISNHWLLWIWLIWLNVVNYINISSFNLHLTEQSSIVSPSSYSGGLSGQISFLNFEYFSFHLHHPPSSSMIIGIAIIVCKGRVQKKKTWKSVVFCQTGGGGVSGGGEKTKLLFWNRVFFREYLESF